MRKLTFLLLTTFITGSFAATSEKNVKSKIEKVTVYMTGAQVQRSAIVSTATGNTVVIFDDLEAGIDGRSIQASGTGNFIILDVKHKVKYPETGATKRYSKHEKEIRMLEDSILNVDYDLESVASKQDVLNTEKNLLLNNKLIKGDNKNDTLPELKDALIFFREKLNNINAELLKLKKENYRLTIIRNRMQVNLNELKAFEQQNANSLRATTNYQVHVTISSETPVQGNLNITYYLQSAGWTPSYDLRTNSINGSMALTYKAHVYQNTGNDWNDVKLTLSTSNPRESNVKPFLSTYYINYYRAYKKYKNKAAELKELEMSKAEEVYNNAPASAVVTDEKAGSIADYTTMQEQPTNYEYNIRLPYTIPSDGQTHLVAIQNKDIPASFEHFAIPKVDPNAFLLAKVTGWDDLNLIPGAANLFFDGSYVGETYIDPANTNDTLEISAGRDKSIVLKREKLRNKTKERVLADEKVQTVTFEITVRNTKSVSSIVTLEDQIPVSNIKEIKVELKDADGGKLNADTGKLTWTLDLKPKETKKITVTYEVRHPKDKVLSAL